MVFSWFEFKKIEFFCLDGLHGTLYQQGDLITYT